MLETKTVDGGLLLLHARLTLGKLLSYRRKSSLQELKALTFVLLPLIKGKGFPAHAVTDRPVLTFLHMLTQRVLVQFCRTAWVGALRDGEAAALVMAGQIAHLALPLAAIGLVYAARLYG